MKKILILIVVVLVFILVFRCQGKRDHAYFESFISEMERAEKEKNYEDFTDFFSLSYRDENGLNYLYIKNITKRYFDKYERFSSSQSINSVSDFYRDETDNELVDINLDVRVTGFVNGIPADLIGSSNNPDNLTITLRRSVTGSWKVVSISGVDRK